jgi:flagellar biosynthesis chaperone FliJ
MSVEPDITLRELQDRLADKGIGISRQSINDTRCMHWDTAIKKTAHAAEQERPDVAAKRHHWRNWQTRLKPERLARIFQTRALDAAVG